MNNTPRVLIIGANGMAGHTITKYLTSLEKYDIRTMSRDDNSYYCNLDIEDSLKELTHIVKRHDFDIVINCIGLLVKPCQDNPARAIYINSFFPHYLERITKNSNTKIIHLSTDCFTENVKVLTENGLISIKNIKIGDEVFTHTGKIQKVYNILQRPETKEIYKIKTIGNDEIETTSNHPFYIVNHTYHTRPNLNLQKWEYAKNLKIGDLIAVPKITNYNTKTIEIKLSAYNLSDAQKAQTYYAIVNEYNKTKKYKGILNFLSSKYSLPKSVVFNWVHNIQKPKKLEFNSFVINDDLAWLFGIFCAEGWAQKDRNSVYFCYGDEPNLISKTCNIIKKYFKIVPTIKKLKGQKGSQVIFYDKLLTSFFIKEFYNASEHFSHTKKIPRFVFNFSQSQLIRFLKGYFDGDGCYYEDKRQSFISFSSVSEQLINEIKLLFMFLGVLPNKTKRTTKTTHIQERKINSRYAYNLQISGKQLIKTLSILSIKNRCFNKARYNRFFENEQYWFVPITNISIQKYKGVVYNLEVENDHSYLVNGGLSAHNCVFSGKKGNYLDTDILDGEGWYAKSKALGELNNEKDLTIRMSIIGKELKGNGSGLFEWFLAQTGTIKGYSEAYWTGLTTLELSKAIDKIITNTNLTGIYQLAMRDKISKHDLLCQLNSIFRNDELYITQDNTYKCDKSLINSSEIIPGYKLPNTYYDMLMEYKEYLK